MAIEFEFPSQQYVFCQKDLFSLEIEKWEFILHTKELRRVSQVSHRDWSIGKSEWGDLEFLQVQSLRVASKGGQQVSVFKGVQPTQERETEMMFLYLA